MTTNYGQFFETKTRDNGASFVTLKDEAPEWLGEAVRDAHHGDLPNDWIFAQCEAAVDAFDNGNVTSDDDVHEHADAQVDVYTKDVFQWAADFCLSSTYGEAEEEAADMGTDTKEIVKVLQAIQYCAISRIVRIMLEACENAENASDDGASDGDEESAGAS